MPRSSVQTQHARVLDHHVTEDRILRRKRVSSELGANRKWFVSEFGRLKVDPSRACATGDKTGRPFPLVSSDNTLVRGAVLYSTS